MVRGLAIGEPEVDASLEKTRRVAATVDANPSRAYTGARDGWDSECTSDGGKVTLSAIK
jgi:hypothetical protein